MDPRSDFIEKVEMKSTRVKSFRGFVFMCGGPHDVRRDPESLRSLVVREMTSGKYDGLAARIKLAEEIQDWFRDGTYLDLVSLEEHLASLSSVIVLIVESGGAIAELGVFSTSLMFSERMLTLVSNSHYEKDSFISLGPVKRLERLHDKRVLVYDWIDQDERGRDVLRLEGVQEDVKEIVGSILGILHQPEKERVFRWEDSSHVMLLICELCDLFGALQLKEIEGYLGGLGGSIALPELKQFIFLMKHCGMLSQRKFGHAVYYYAVDWDTHISFALGGSQIDRDRLRVDVSDFYKMEDVRRATVIQRILSHAD